MKLVFAVIFLCTSHAIAQPPLKIEKLTSDFFVFTTYKDINGTRFPSNGMYVVTVAGVVMIDTPWDTTQLMPLLDTIRLKHQSEVVLAIATHFHDDRTGGLRALNALGISTYTSKLTDKLCAEYHEPRPTNVFLRDTTFIVGQYSIQTYYPGQGHTTDNIVIWLPVPQILYGGCLIKSTDASDLGNTTDSNVRAWPTSIRNIRKKYGTPPFIIPGHQSWSNNGSLRHTLSLLKKNP